METNSNNPDAPANVRKADLSDSSGTSHQAKIDATKTKPKTNTTNLLTYTPPFKFSKGLARKETDRPSAAFGAPASFEKLPPL